MGRLILELRRGNDGGFTALESADAGRRWFHRIDIGERSRAFWREYARANGCILREPRSAPRPKAKREVVPTNDLFRRTAVCLSRLSAALMEDNVPAVDVSRTLLELSLSIDGKGVPREEKYITAALNLTAIVCASVGMQPDGWFNFNQENPGVIKDGWYYVKVERYQHKELPLVYVAGWCQDYYDYEKGGDRGAWIDLSYDELNLTVVAYRKIEPELSGTKPEK